MPDRVQGHRVEAIDGLRGVAILLVLALHAHLPFSGGGTFGVDIFFVLSGFLITSVLLDSRRAALGNGFFYGAFLARRAGRLLPGLLVGVLVVGVWALLTDSGSARCTTLALTHTMNVPALGGAACSGPWHVTWSLAAEEQFYLLWPAVLFLLLAWKGSHRFAARLVLGAWLVASVVVVAGSVTGSLSPDVLNYAPWGRSLAVLLGCSLALWTSRTQPWSARASRVLACVPVPAVVLLVVTLAVAGSSWIDGQAKLAPIVAGTTVALLAVLATAPVAWLGAALAIRPLVWLGRGSYSLYLQHMVPITVARGMLPESPLVAGALGVIAALVLAALSYHLVENPVRGAVNRRLHVVTAGRLTRPAKREGAAPPSTPRELAAIGGR